MLTGADPAPFGNALLYLGKRPAVAGWPAYWPRVWGARGLLYVWSDSESNGAADAVLEGLRDEHWRVAEMCLKVSAKRELPGAEDAARLATHELARVRVAALRVLGECGETEQVPGVTEALADADEAVRRSAARAFDRLSTRLDLP